MSHTPGPWEVGGATHVYKGGDGGANICTVSSPRQSKMVGYTPLELSDPDFKEACANARLIAAVPEMLKLLRRYSLVAADNNLAGELVDDVRALLAKIDGGE